MNGRKRHDSFHTTQYGKDTCKYDKPDSSIPEWQSEQELKEDTTRKSRNTHFCEYVSYECNDRKPCTCTLGIAEFKEIGHGDDFAHLIVQ